MRLPICEGLSHSPEDNRCAKIAPTWLIAPVSWFFRPRVTWDASEGSRYTSETPGRPELPPDPLPLSGGLPSGLAGHFPDVG
jgi:hypothetical protein